jgi:phosphoserine phosphatase
MLQLILLRPGSTDFDEQGRITGRLDIPLSDLGKEQVSESVLQLSGQHIDTVYCCPCQSAAETGEALAKATGSKLKKLEKLSNLDQGLWHGKLIDDVKLHQPRVYKLWQEKPETVCPPGGETLAAMRERVEATVKKVLKKHREGVIALIAPEPLASLIRACVTDCEIGDLWAAECEKANWEIIALPRLTAHSA